MEIRSICISPKHISNKLTTIGKKTKETLKKKPWSTLDKKKVMIGCAVLMIGAAIYLNYAFFLNDTDLTSNSADENIVSTNVEENDLSNFFAQTSLDRQKARDEALQVLQIVVDNEDALEESKNTALLQMSQIADDIQKESNIESLVCSKGFEECVAVINDGRCNVVVKCDGLQANEISQIKEIIYEQADINPINVKIIEKN